MSELRGTYRLQLGPDLRFSDVRALVPYLRDLGISHLYLSPSLQARSGSTHGYDVVDPTRVSEELGGEQELRALAGEGLGVVLDIVPNHMGTGDENRWWTHERERVFDVDPETGHYRRFFDIDDLAAVRAERDDVFELTHRKVLELLADGVLEGVRVDHPDGLADPAGYLRRLRDSGARHVWVEKILHPGEPLRDWPVDGTVGYEFLVDATSLFVDPAGEEPLTALYGELTGETRDFATIAREAQLEQATGTFHREIAWLRRFAERFDERTIAEALADIPVYRTYVEPWSGKVDELDRRAVAALPEDLRRVLLLEERGFDEFVTRFQQTSPPVTAKGIEDTAFYRYNRLLALNEVGNDPARFGIGPDAMHAANRERAERFPTNLLITSTHDTKRSADVRARIAALASMPEAFGDVVRRTFELSPPPDRNEGWMVLQTLVGAWPIEFRRLDGYLEKALREGKVNSSWAEPDSDHERAVTDWARGLATNDGFLEFFVPFQGEVAAAAWRGILGQVLLKMTCPGIPDVYGGDEFQYFALVDPDNRRPVDFDARRRALERRANPKLRLIEAALDLRARRPGAFSGAYEPVEAGPGVCAYARGAGEVLVVVGLRGWETARLQGAPGGAFRHVISGREVEVAPGVAVSEVTGPLGLALLEAR